jgi:hypothetical protein
MGRLPVGRALLNWDTKVLAAQKYRKKKKKKKEKQEKPYARPSFEKIFAAGRSGLSIF